MAFCGSNNGFLGTVACFFGLFWDNMYNHACKDIEKFENETLTYKLRKDICTDLFLVRDSAR